MTISLITATYNSGKTVEDTLRSVLAQTYKEIDYWIVDGGSKDDTMDIVSRCLAVVCIGFRSPTVVYTTP